MNPELKSFAIRKFLEGLVFSVLVGAVVIYFLTWPAYFALGALVAVVLAFVEFKKEPSLIYLVVAVFNVVLWPAMIYNNVTRQSSK